jgi:RHS repeat-associated protein
VTTGGTTSPLGYDPKGNLLSRPAALASPALGLVWDFDNRLRGADTNGTPASQEVSFEYDALGRRVARSETGNNVVYVHAGQQVIADYARGAAAAAPSFRYVYGSYVDEPLLRHAGTGTTLPTSGTTALYYHRNQQYSIVGLSNAAGALVERYAYTAYGELTILAPDRSLRATSSFQNRYTYTGREWDPTLRLYYFRARWLEPKAGRFIGRDPLGYVDGMGLYGAYFGLTSVDPSGLETWETTVVGKSFIADIDKHGGVGTDPHSLSIPLFDTTGFINLDLQVPWPSDWLRGQGSYWLFNTKEDPANDAKDGKYRLYSRLKLEFECCDGKLKIDPSQPRVESDGGAEVSIPKRFTFRGDSPFGLPLTGVPAFVPETPVIWGTIDIDNFTYEPLGESSMRFRYRAFGKPNPIAEPSFNLIKPRKSKYIWHDVEVVVSCEGERGFHRARFFDVSGFPSHRLWVNGGSIPEDEKMQGSLDLLWQGDPKNPEFVVPRGNR